MMYTTTTPITLPVGTVLALTKGQYADRANALQVQSAKKGLYLTTAIVQFKAGESIGIEGDLPKHLVDLMRNDAPAKPSKATDSVVVDPPATSPEAAPATVTDPA